MKKIIFSVLSLILVVSVFTSCDETYDDLMTADAKTGGLLEPQTSIAYLLNATPVVNVPLTIPKGPGVTTIEVYNTYLRRSDTTYSNETLIKTIEVGGANAAENYDASYTITYADLKNGILVENTPLPDDESVLPIGDSWYLSYVSTMEDGRKIVNSSSTKIDVSNRWAASYLLSGFVLRAGDDVLSGYLNDVPWKLATNSAKSVVYYKIHPWADGSTIGGIGPWVLTIDDSAGPDAPMPVTVTDAANPAVKNNPEYNSRYEPSTKTFYISVFWGSGPTNRAATDTLVYSGPY